MYILYFIFYILYFIFYILYFIFYILYFIFYILYFILFTNSLGIVGGYVHGGEGDTKAGRLGALVTLVPPHDNADRNALTKLAAQIAMHIVGLNPKCVDTDSPVVTQALADARAAPNARADISAADIAEDVVLLEQKFFGGDGETVREMLARAGAPGTPVRVHSFLRLAVGEGIDKVKSDFADEVMGMVKK